MALTECFNKSFPEVVINLSALNLLAGFQNYWVPIDVQSEKNMDINIITKPAAYIGHIPSYVKSCVFVRIAERVTQWKGINQKLLKLMKLRIEQIYDWYSVWNFGDYQIGFETRFFEIFGVDANIDKALKIRVHPKLLFRW